ncbi:hypothetical protein [Haloarchaeobius sp. TZWWS8]|uniref:hypothetical protein n=1 Tax=Haloarchaeobius sp. TZWWS8 TaxID=3446121 RepID=UPI003EBD2309
MRWPHVDDRMAAVLRRSNQNAYRVLRFVLIGLLVRGLVRDRELDRGILGALLLATAVDAIFQVYYQTGGLDEVDDETGRNSVKLRLD